MGHFPVSVHLSLPTPISHSTMETHSNILFSVDRNDVVLVKPFKPTPSEVLSLSTIDNDRNLEIMCHSVFVYQANGAFCNEDSPDEVKSKVSELKDPACIIQEALSKALVYYYPLAGKLKRQTDGRLRITCNAADGVPFLVATANCHLSSLNHLDGIDVPTAKQFAFDFPSESDDGYHPLVMQVTKFLCGGFTIALSLSHSVCDGFGASQFFRALAELASGKNEPSVKPVWEREILVSKPVQEIPQFIVADKESLATSPYLPTTDIVHECFYVTADSVKTLKMNLMKESKDEFLKDGVTSLEVLSAYVWRARFRALKLNSDGRTIFCMAVGIRRTLKPPLPEGYYGNAFTSANAAMAGKDLNEGSLTKAVKQIKESKKLASNNDYIWKLMSINEKFIEQNMKLEGTAGATMVITDWRQLGLLEDIDFGWKGSVNMIPLPWNMFGYVDLVLLLPPCKLDQSMKGGVRVLVSLPRAAIAKFREEMDALKHGDEVAGY